MQEFWLYILLGFFGGLFFGMLLLASFIKSIATKIGGQNNG